MDKEQLRQALYAGSPWDLCCDEDNKYRNAIDRALDQKRRGEVCAWCGADMYTTVRAHHHTEMVNGVLVDVTQLKKTSDFCPACKEDMRGEDHYCNESEHAHIWTKTSEDYEGKRLKRCTQCEIIKKEE